ncbi:MAG: hypothetical protein WCC06_09810 [Candidatus Aminicenantales bacterium]
MNQSNIGNPKGIYSIRMDYENIDVANIMDQIKRIVTEQPEETGTGGLFPEDAGPGMTPEPGAGLSAGDQAGGLKQKVRAKIARLMEPFFPLIRLLGLPIHEELMRTIQSLHETNKRLDYLDRKLAERDMSMDYIKLLHNLSHNLVVEMTKLKIEEEDLKSKMRILEKDLEILQKREKALEKKTFK